MVDPKITRREVLAGAGAAGVLGAFAGPAMALAVDGPNVRIRWDIVNVLTGCAEPGGQASARTVDGARITVTGSGTFPNVNRCRKDVTGGGTWSITPGTATSGCFSGSGDFTVTELLSWVVAPGVFPLPCDNIGELEDARAGLAKVRVRYSNGEAGVLTVSCHLAGTGDCVFEGITATMRHEDFTFPEPPTAGQEGNRTLFHVVHPGLG
jgi:hypothetical protein